MVSSTGPLSLNARLDVMPVWRMFDTNKPPSGPANRRRDIFHIVVTPERIPKFIIPSLAVSHVFLHVEPAGGVQESPRGRSVASQDVASPRTRRSRSEANIRKGSWIKERSRTGSHYVPGDLEKVADHSDTPTKAAWSLPHLPKITTPYGFPTLGESPNIRRKESLFFDWDDWEGPSLSPLMSNSDAMSRNASGLLRKPERYIETMKEKPSMPLTWEVVCCTSPDSSFPASSTSKKCEKKTFNFLRRTRLSRIRCLKCHGK